MRYILHYVCILLQRRTRFEKSKVPLMSRCLNAPRRRKNVRSVEFQEKKKNSHTKQAIRIYFITLFSIVFMAFQVGNLTNFQLVLNRIYGTFGRQFNWQICTPGKTTAIFKELGIVFDLLRLERKTFSLEMSLMNFNRTINQ